MTGAMYAAVSGLKAHMSALNVVGNNIANVNTNAYKATRFTFSESLYTSVSSGSNGTNTTGGTNPAQIGYGCSLGTVDLDMSTKNYSPTGESLDTMIDGDGFFLVGDKDCTNPNQLKLTRLGNFKFDSDGYLTDGEGNVVFGFEAAKASDASTDITPVPVLTPLRYPAASVGDATTGAGKGEAVYPTFDGTTYTPVTDSDVSGVVQLDSVGISQKTGAITGVDSSGNPVTIGYLAIGKVTNPNGVTHVDGRYYQALDGAGKLSIHSVKGVVTNTIDATAGSTTQINGRDAIDITSAGDTNLITGGLESSGTDLATEITSMITIQRGYQANTRIVTVTDSMLEELVNMKR